MNCPWINKDYCIVVLYCIIKRLKGRLTCNCIIITTDLSPLGLRLNDVYTSTDNENKTAKLSYFTFFCDAVLIL